MTQYRQARRRTLEKIQRAAAMQASPWRGRWTLTHRAGILGPPHSPEQSAAKWAQLLLERYGVVTRDFLQRLEIPNLDLVFAEWQRMEWRGQVRRGIFVGGRTGIQYALPEAVEQLRAISGEQTSDTALQAGGALYLLNATDPANIFGGEENDQLTGLPRFARLPSTYLVLQNGQPILLAQDSGERLTVPADADISTLNAALRVFFNRPAAPRHAVVTLWNDTSILGSAGEKILQALGFFRMPKGMELWQK